MIDSDEFSQKYLAGLENVLRNIAVKDISRLVNFLSTALDERRTVFVCGNGGSAATASHMVCDLDKTTLGKFPKGKKRFRVLSLNDNIPLLSAWANDVSYSQIFAEPLENFASEGDSLLVLTGSGNSENILEVLRRAKSLGVRSFALLGFDGGRAKDLADDYLLINSDDYGFIEDAHGVLNHLVTAFFKAQLGKGDD